MKRILVLILILTFVGTSLLAKTEIKVKKEPLRNDVSPTINHTTIIGTDDPGDILLDYDVQTPTATICPGEDNQLLGCEFDGTYIWVTGGGGTVAAMPNQLYKYDSDGNILAFYPQGTSSAWGMRDMAFDGTYLYAGDDNGFYQIDPVDGSVTTLFTGNLGLSCIRALAYSPSTGYFYACNWNTHIVIFDATGTQQGTLTNPGNGDNYGMAYDEFDTTGDYLWLFSQQGTPATTFYQYDMNTQALTGVTYVVPYLTGAIDQMAGGACFTTNLVPGKCVLGGITQGDPVDRFFAMELADAADPAAPGPPTDVVVTPDAGGALEAQIDWICPTLQVNGDPLTELLEMRVYRDDVLIYTDTAPVIGGPGSYTDSAVLASGTYSYKVVGYNSFDEGIPVTVTVWVGEDVPDAVTDLTLTDVSTDDLMAQLDWVNPTTGLHGGYFPGVTGYDIERSDGATFTIGGPVTLWIDDTIVDPGIYWYAVTPFNNSGSGPSTQTPSVGIGISVIEVGNAEITDYQIPMNLYWHNTIVETVYDKEWIGEGMIINAIAFHAASITNTINPFNFEIWLGEIDIDDLSGGWIDASQLTMVFDGTIDVPTGEYWLEIPLDTPFIYENNDNLVMGIIKDDDQYYSPSGSDVWWTTESGTANRTLHEYSDSEEFSIQNPPADLNPKTTYADVRFYYSGIADPLAPGEPTDVTFIPDAGGALECDISWTCPSLNYGGDPLTELLEMRVYRDGALVYTDTNPTIGGPGSYTDVVPASGYYEYEVLGYNSYGEGPGVSGEPVWVGEDVPAAVEALLLEEMGGNGYLTWINPTTGLHGGPFNEPILGYHIVRYPDNVTFELAGIATSFLDDTIPGADYYHYDVTPYNSVGDGGTATSNTMMLGAGTVLFFDDFEAGLGNWIVEQNGQPGLWMIYSEPFPNAYTLPPTSTGNICGADSDEIYPVDAELILASALDLSTYETVNVQFDNDWNSISASDWAYLDVSNDGGTTWINLISWDDDVRETHEIIDITAYAAFEPNVLIRFHSVQPGWDWWWVIDNVGIYGTGGVPLAPPTNLNVDEYTGLFTWDPPVLPPCSREGDKTKAIEATSRDLIGYNVYLDGILLGSTTFTEWSYEDLVYLQEYIAGVSAVYDDPPGESIVVEYPFTFLFTGAGNDIPLITELNGNFPNPFNPDTEIKFSIKDPGHVTLNVFNIRGQLVKTLVDEKLEPKHYSVIWDGKDNSGKSVSSGIYFYKMCLHPDLSGKAGGRYTSTKKMILMK